MQRRMVNVNLILPDELGISDFVTQMNVIFSDSSVLVQLEDNRSTPNDEIDLPVKIKDMELDVIYSSSNTPLTIELKMKDKYEQK